MLPVRDLWLFEVFVAVVEHDSMAAAGRRLHMSTPAVSEAMANLESKLGTRLLVRSPTGSRPTADGRHIYNVASRLLEDTRATLDDVSREQHVQYDVGSVFGSHTGAIAATAEQSQSPITGVSMSISDPGQTLLSGEVDMALLMGPTQHDAKLRRRYVFSEPRVALGSPATVGSYETLTIAALDNLVWPSIPPGADHTYLAPWLCCDIRGMLPPRQGPALTDPFELVAWLQSDPETVVATTPALAHLFSAQTPLLARPIDDVSGWRVDLVRRRDDTGRHFDAIAAALTANAPDGAFVDLDIVDRVDARAG